MYARAFHLVILHGDDFSMVQMIPKPDDCDEVISSIAFSAKGARVCTCDSAMLFTFGLSPVNPSIVFAHMLHDSVPITTRVFINISFRLNPACCAPDCRGLRAEGGVV